MARVVCLLIVLFGQLFGSDAFIFSYKGITANQLLVYEEKNIASVMQNNEQNLPTKKCQLPLKYDFKSSKEGFLKNHFDLLLGCFYPQRTHMLSWGEHHAHIARDRVEFIVLPTRFTVDFKDEFATINTYQ